MPGLAGLFPLTPGLAAAFCQRLWYGWPFGSLHVIEGQGASDRPGLSKNAAIPENADGVKKKLEASP